MEHRPKQKFTMINMQSQDHRVNQMIPYAFKHQKVGNQQNMYHLLHIHVLIPLEQTVRDGHTRRITANWWKQGRIHTVFRWNGKFTFFHIHVALRWSRKLLFLKLPNIPSWINRPQIFTCRETQNNSAESIDGWPEIFITFSQGCSAKIAFGSYPRETEIPIRLHQYVIQWNAVKSMYCVNRV